MSDTVNKFTDRFRVDADKKIHPFTSAVVLAAGLGLRFSKNGITKQNVPLNGIPVIVHTLFAFEKSLLTDEVILVSREEELELFNQYTIKYGLKKVSQIVCGGETRQDSSLCGFNAIADEAKYVAIHDGARCLVTPEIIDSTIKEAYEYRSAAAAQKSSDTVKYANRRGFIEKTIDRDHVWLIKTPQVFMCDIYRASAYMAKKDNVSVTDDAMMAERLGFSIKLVECGSQNMKITRREDVEIAQAILKDRNKN